MIIKLDDERSIPLGESVTCPISSPLFVIEDIGNNQVRVQLSEEPTQEYEPLELDSVNCTLYQQHMTEKWKPHRWPIEERGM